MKIKNFLHIFLLGLIVALGSCSDDYFNKYEQIGEGDAMISARVNFRAFNPALESRGILVGGTPGDAIKNITDFCVFIYDDNADETKSTLIKTYYFNEQNCTIDQGGNTSMPPDEGNQSEAKTPHAEFNMTLPFGTYKMYVVANMGDITKDAYDTPEKLKNISLTWDNSNIAANNKMFGYFTTAEHEQSKGFDAPVIAINQRNMKLHSWVKRTTSKVTIAYDISQLKENVHVYIQKVAIYDIPKTCYLGKSNKPDKADQLWPNSEDAQAIYYNGPDTASQSHSNWLHLLYNVNSPTKNLFGAVDHTETDPALYFFENNQGDKAGQGSQFNKEMADDVQFGDKPSRLPGDKDYKDGVEYGTFIEVTGYYNSENSGRLTKGPIKYRFMLGKNTTYNYNAERNHHYKLTLVLKGYANEADWHIDYEEEKDEVNIKAPYYISYLYNEDLNNGLPIRLSKTAKYLKAEIIKNNWAPYDTVTKKVPPSQPGGTFAWNKEAYDILNTEYDADSYGGSANFLGFLSLRKIQKPDNNIPSNEMTEPKDKNGYGPNTMRDLINVYVNGKENIVGTRNNSKVHDGYILEEGTHNIDGDPKNGTYRVTYDADGSKTVYVQMWTRSKMFGPMTGFSGNNLYEAYMRQAVVRFTIGFEQPDGSIKEKTEDVEIRQVKRITNPKAIWRDRNSTQSFDVTILELADPGATQYREVISDGSWRVSVEKGGDWVKITDVNGNEPGSDGYLHGSDENPIKFKYAPRSTTSSDRCGIIKVEYNDYSCVHRIFVRQGYEDDLQISPKSNTRWSCKNVYAFTAVGDVGSTQPSNKTAVNCIVTKSPLAIGSLFKRQAYNYAILESNNNKYGFDVTPSGPLTTCYYKNANERVTRENSWDYFWGFATVNTGGVDRKSYKWADTMTAINNGNKKYRVPTYEDYDALQTDQDNVASGFGIVYGDGATAVVTDVQNASSYIDSNNTGAQLTSGVRACIVYNKNNANQILFPLGNKGYGKRAKSDLVKSGNNYVFVEGKGGKLIYSTVIGYYLKGGLNVYRPNIYNLWHNNGAVYWINMIKKQGHKADKDDCHGWDINAFTLAFSEYDSGALFSVSETSPLSGLQAGSSSIAAPIKLVAK